MLLQRIWSYRYFSLSFKPARKITLDKSLDKISPLKALTEQAWGVIFVLDAIQFNSNLKFKSISILLVLDCLELQKALQDSLTSLHYLSTTPLRFHCIWKKTTNQQNKPNQTKLNHTPKTHLFVYLFFSSLSVLLTVRWTDLSMTSNN